MFTSGLFHEVIRYLEIRHFSSLNYNFFLVDIK